MEEVPSERSSRRSLTHRRANNTLSAKLNASKINSGQHDFIPKGKLQVILSHEAVKTELERNLRKCPTTKDPKEFKKLIKFICRKVPRTFAALVLSRHTELVDLLYWAKADEHQFPFKPEDLIEILDKGLNNCPHTESMWPLDDTDLNNYLWDIVESMVPQQRCLAAQVFDCDVFEYQLDTETPLPFLPVPDQSVNSGRGGYGEVQEKLIHCDHLLLSDDVKGDLQRQEVQGGPAFRVAQKQLMKVDKWKPKEFEDMARKEAQNLKDMNAYDHKHFIRGLSYYKQGGDHFFLFPWAEGGNLDQYWVKADRSLPSTHCWAIKQLAGLASGLRTLHKNNCRHGDIKPQNILCFGSEKSKSHRRLVIADFGLAKVHQEWTEFRNHATKTTATSVTYSPPEFNLNARRDEPASRAYDIWSIGCVFLEFVIWLACGQKELEKFRDDLRGRVWSKPPVPFWVGDPAEDLHAVVKDEINYLRGRLTNGSPLYRIIELVEQRLLVINAARRKNLPNPQFEDHDEAAESKSPALRLIPATFHSESGFRSAGGATRADARELDEKMAAIANGLDERTYKLEFLEKTPKERTPISVDHLRVDGPRRGSRVLDEPHRMGEGLDVRREENRLGSD